MSTHAGWDWIGASGSYPAVAAQAVMSTHHQSPFPVYGYLRAGAQQKIYLFYTVDQGRAWYDGLVHGGTEPHDYAALFVATDLRAPVAENFGHPAAVSGDTEVGQFWPFALGLPAGALGGYFYRKWQEGHPGKLIPGISGEVVGAYPWVDIVGAEVPDGRRRTRELIKSAIREVIDAQAAYPAQAYVWSLEAPGPSPSSHVELYGTTQIIPFASHDQALAHLRDRIHTDHVALALFDRSSPHWPNPVNWTKSHDPAHEPVIAQQIAKYAPPRAAGDVVGAWPWQSIVGAMPWHSIVGAESVGAVPWHSIVGAESVGAGPWYTIIGAALDVLRRQAKAAAEEMPGRVIGVLRDARGKWQLKSFYTVDDADDWFGASTVEPRDFTYAAYFEKDRNGIAYLENEKIGGARVPSSRGAGIPREIASVTVAP